MDFFDRVKQLAKKTEERTLQKFIFSIGLNYDSYQSWKKAGNLPRADDALTIAQALGTTVEFLVSGKESVSFAADEAFGKIEAVIKQYRKVTKG